MFPPTIFLIDLDLPGYLFYHQCFYFFYFQHYLTLQTLCQVLSLCPTTVTHWSLETLRKYSISSLCVSKLVQHKILDFCTRNCSLTANVFLGVQSIQYHKYFLGIYYVPSTLTGAKKKISKTEIPGPSKVLMDKTGLKQVGTQIYDCNDYREEKVLGLWGHMMVELTQSSGSGKA